MIENRSTPVVPLLAYELRRKLSRSGRKSCRFVSGECRKLNDEDAMPVGRAV